MANTRWAGIRRPAVGDPYDRSATSFDPNTHIDILDELDSSIQLQLDALHLLSAAPVSKKTIANTAYADQGGGKAHVVDGGSLVVLTDNAAKLWYVHSTSEYTAPGNILVAGYYSAKIILSYQDPSTGYSVVQLATTTDYPTFTTKYDDSDPANQRYGPLAVIAYMGGWATPTLLVSDGFGVLSSTDDLTTITHHGNILTGGPLADYAIFSDKLVVAYRSNTLSVLDSTMTNTSVTLPSPMSSVAYLAVYDGVLYIFGYDSSNNLYIAWTSDLTNFSVFQLWDSGSGSSISWYSFLFFRSILALSFAISGFSPPEDDRIIGVPHLHGGVQKTMQFGLCGFLAPEGAECLLSGAKKPSPIGRFGAYGLLNNGTGTDFIKFYEPNGVIVGP